MASPQTSNVHLLNTLPRALAHFENEVRATLGDAAAHLTSLATPSAEVGSLGAARKALRATEHALFLRRQRTPFLSVWPALGHLEFVAAGRGTRGAIILHDPDPIRPSAGYGMRAVRAGAKVANAAGHLAIAHSRAAEVRLEEMGYEHVVRIAHPMFEPIRADRPEGAPGAVRVLGQYKPTRDVELLAGLGTRLGALGVECEIVGRGWPEIPGWQVTNAFVSEAELDRLVATAGVVLVPYTRYWQSGLAVRASEHSVQVVGAGGGFLDELLGSDAPGLVVDTDDLDEWVAAVLAALEAPIGAAEAAARSYFLEARAGWSALVADLARESANGSSAASFGGSSPSNVSSPYESDPR